ncbi:MAG: EamA family transporter, partial [Rhodospirillales bacterium]|nr:EamA family transporter [Rhodospirillales bacterium]
MSISARWYALYDSLPSAGRASIWILIAATCFTSMMAIARELSPGLHVFVIVLFRNLFGMMFLSPLLIRHGPGLLRTKKTPFFILRSICAFTALSCYFFAATMIPLADIAAINFTRPIFATIAAMVLLGEVARMHRWGSIALGLRGALIVSRPGFQEVNPGILFVFAAV